LNNVIFAAFALAALACSPAKQDNTTASTESASTVATESSATQASTATASKNEEKPMSNYLDKVAELHTSAGEIDIRFFPDVAPNHVRNFIDLAEKGFYNGIKFHRVIPGFMIQGGDPNTISGDRSTWGAGGSPNKLKAEFNGVHHARGIVSAARTSDPNSASSQFFICVADAGYLDRQYTVFGQVTKGMDVVDKIVNAPKGNNDQPANPTTIESVKIRPANENEKGPAPQ
jgi:peptidyl-prolyl cis-trans isomerase B (cyclophilin B)